MSNSFEGGPYRGAPTQEEQLPMQVSTILNSVRSFYKAVQSLFPNKRKDPKWEREMALLGALLEARGFTEEGYQEKDGQVIVPKQALKYGNRKEIATRAQEAYSHLKRLIEISGFSENEIFEASKKLSEEELDPFRVMYRKSRYERFYQDPLRLPDPYFGGWAPDEREKAIFRMEDEKKMIEGKKGFFGKSWTKIVPPKKT